MSTMQTTRKRKGEPLAPPAKKKPPPEPRVGSRRIIRMILHSDNQELPVRALLDSASSLPILSKSFATRYSIKSFIRTEQLEVQTFAGDSCPDIGKEYSYPLLLQHHKHWTKESFEISPTDSDCDILIPWWWLLKHVPSNFFSTGDVRLDSEKCTRSCTKETASVLEVEYDDNVAYDAATSNIATAGCLGYVRTGAQGKPQVSWAVVSSVTLDSDVDMEDVVDDSKIPAVYHEFLSVFSQSASDSLPPHRSFDHAIELKDGEEPPWGPIYALSETELTALREYLEEMLRTGKIRPSKSPAGAPILFVPKAHGRGLRLCVDYRGLNRVTVLNRYPLPLMNELRDRVQGSTVFTK
jgi:hypothetical protein